MNIALILAAGRGTRFGNEIPKQFIVVDEKPLYIYCLEQFEYCDKIDKIVIAFDEGHINNLEYKDYGITKVHEIVIGGQSRQETVRKSLNAIKAWAKNDDIILIHDSARPLLTEDLIIRNIEECKIHDAVTSALPSVDSILESVDHNKISSITNRKNMYLIQTPQTFKFSLIYWAHENAVQNGIYHATEDCQLVAKLNKPIFLVEGERRNIKITTREDLVLFKELSKDL